MAINFQSGTFTGQKDLLSILNTFLSGGAGASWSVDAFAAPPGLPNDLRLIANFQTNAMRFNIETRVQGATGSRPRMFMAAHSGLDTLLDFDDQPGGYGAGNFEGISVQHTDTDFAGNPTLTSNYWFFADTDYLIVVLEIGQGSGWIQHFFWGRLSNFSVGINNGFFIHGTVPRSLMTGAAGAAADYNDVSLITNRLAASSFIGVQGNESNTYSGHLFKHNGSWVVVNNVDPDSGSSDAYLSFNRGTGGALGTEDSEVTVLQPRWTTNPASIVPTMSPSHMFAPSAAIGGNTYAPMGEIPGAYYIPLDQGLSEGQSLSIGPDEYLVFPCLKTQRFAHRDQFTGIAVQKV